MSNVWASGNVLCIRFYTAFGVCIVLVKEMEKAFDVVIEKDEHSGQFYASVPSLPGCYSYADGMEELLKNIKEAIELHLEVVKKKKIKLGSDSVVGMVKVMV